MLQNVLNAAQGALGAMLIFGLAILAHELGHFILAKIGGVGVKEFAIGMGPKLFSIHRGGTDYSIRAIPFGGFVMMEGAMPEDEEEAAPAVSPPEGGESAEASAGKKKDLGPTLMEDMDALRNKGMLIKISIFAAGVFFNYLAATAAIGLKYSVGFEDAKPLSAQVGEIPEGSTLSKAGLRTLDSVAAVDGKTVKTFDEFLGALAGDEKSRGWLSRTWRRIHFFGAPAEDEKSPVSHTVEIDRGGERTTISLPPLLDPKNPKEWDAFYIEPKTVDRPLLLPAYTAYVAGVIPTTPAERGGLRPGDTIIEINDKPVKYFFELTHIIRANAGQALKIEINRPGGKDPVVAYLVADQNSEIPGEGQIGIAPGNASTERVHEPVWQAFAKAPLRAAAATAFIAQMTFKTLHKLTTNFKAAKKDVAGPVGIMTMAFRASQEGLSRVLDLFVVLNLALLVMNLLPLPVLDGGHIAIAIIEGVTGRQIPPRVLGWVFQVMAVLLILLAVAITYRDILVWWLKF